MTSYPKYEFDLAPCGWAGCEERQTHAIGHTVGCIQRSPQRVYLLTGLDFSQVDVWGSLEAAEIVPTASANSSSGPAWIYGRTTPADAVRVRGVTYNQQGKPSVLLKAQCGSGSSSGGGATTQAGAVLVRAVTYSKLGKPIVRTTEYQNKQLE